MVNYHYNMKNTLPLIINIETPAFSAFLSALNIRSIQYQQEHFPNLAADEIVAEQGSRYIRLVRQSTVLDAETKRPISRSAHAFIDRTNGDVLKTAGWSAPAKHARGNILAADNGLDCMGPYGAAYLR